MLVQSWLGDVQRTIGYGALQESAAWLSLPGRGLLSVTGPDRLRFLNAMVTADLRKLNPGDGCYTFLLDARGRVIADATIHTVEGTYLLDTAAGNRHTLFAHLDQYLIADEVQLEDRTFRYSCIGVEGPWAESALQALDVPRPEADHGALSWDSGWVTRTSLTGVSGFRLFVGPEKRAALCAALETVKVMPATDDDVRLVRLEHEKPRWGRKSRRGTWGRRSDLPTRLRHQRAATWGRR